VGLDSLGKSESASLDGGLSIILGSLHGLVLRLKSLDSLLEGGLGIIDLGLTLLDKLLKVGIRHGGELGNLSLLLVIAQVDVSWGADRLQVLIRELLKSGISSLSLVGLKSIGRSPLKGWESLDSVGLAVWLAVSGTVTVSYKSGLVSLEGIHKLVPVWLKLLAVSTPWGIELDKDGLSGGFGLVVVTFNSSERGERYGRLMLVF